MAKWVDKYNSLRRKLEWLKIKNKKNTRTKPAKFRQGPNTIPYNEPEIASTKLLENHILSNYDIPVYNKYIQDYGKLKCNLVGMSDISKLKETILFCCLH